MSTGGVGLLHPLRGPAWCQTGVAVGVVRNEDVISRESAKMRFSQDDMSLLDFDGTP